MPFQKGNKLAKGRELGSKNKATDVNKQLIQELIYNPEEMAKSFKKLDIYKQWDIRCKLAGKFYSSPPSEIELDVNAKPWGNQKMIRLTAPGEEETEVEDWEKAALWEFHGGNLPLFLDKDLETHMKMERYPDHNERT